MGIIDEQWKTIEGFSDYEISNRGRLRKRNGQYVRANLDKYGYERVQIKDGSGTFKNKFIHRLVAAAFVPTHNKRLSVNHKDCCKVNNFAENLEWMTSGQNTRHAIANGCRKSRKLTDDQADEIRRRGQVESHRKLGKEFNVSDETVRQIVRGMQYKVRVLADVYGL